MIPELEELSGAKDVKDLHMHNIDHITITSKKSGKVLHRISEVFDCWFESGGMPFALNHLPFSGKKWQQADFIAEGLDQTRGWFYTLTILSAFLGHPSPFKNVIVNGLILAKDGKKMSKHLKNYPDPEELMEKSGADALRLYLINSPAAHAEPFKFNEDGVKQVVKEVMIPWRNSFKFFVEQVMRHGNSFRRNEKLAFSSKNKLNKWITSRLNRLIQFVHNEMNAYRLYAVLPELIKFIDEMSRWFIRLDKDLIKAGGGESQEGLAALFEVLFNFALLMSPFAPFFSEHAYQQLKPCLNDSEQVAESVHFLMIPTPNEAAIDPSIEESFENKISSI
ncbi:hypothetical protein M9Y10_045301 [Tritrichomonas musculus]|uniref:Isoleucyl-tRNA synthetase n=1 Tax=Tritrichomonas musculus TaxID=1915356 RepID=A0ABR2JUU8_9EUKA